MKRSTGVKKEYIGGKIVRQTSEDLVGRKMPLNKVGPLFV